MIQFQIKSRRKTAKEIPGSSRLEFKEKLSANSFALSDAENNTYGSLNILLVLFDTFLLLLKYWNVISH